MMSQMQRGWYGEARRKAFTLFCTEFRGAERRYLILGVFVSSDAIYLDYRMGPEWGAAEVNSLFELLRHLQTMAQNEVVTLPPGETADFRQRFAKAFAEYGKGAV